MGNAQNAQRTFSDNAMDRTQTSERFRLFKQGETSAERLLCAQGKTQEHVGDIF
jgi:hypothetical protein